MTLYSRVKSCLKAKHILVVNIWTFYQVPSHVRNNILPTNKPKQTQIANERNHFRSKWMCECDYFIQINVTNDDNAIGQSTLIFARDCFAMSFEMNIG